MTAPFDRMPASPMEDRSLLFRRALLAGCGLLCAGAAWAASPGTVVISQVFGGGGNSGSPFKNDFIELHNISNNAVSINGWSVQYSSATGTVWSSKTELSGIIPAGGYFLIAQAAGSGEAASLPSPDASGSIAMSASAGKVALVNSSASLTGSDPHGHPSVVDFVGFGATATGFETAFAPAPGNTGSISRRDSGSSDTDDNSADFVISTPPSPRNSASPPYVPMGAPPDSIAPEVTALAPADNAVGVALDSPLTITFNEPVTAGTGTAGLYDENGLVESFPVSGSVSGNIASFAPGSPLRENSAYHILISTTAFKDAAGNSFAGIADPTVWNFTTTGPDIAGPVPVGLFPANGATAVRLRPEVLQITFNENVRAVAGKTVLLKRADGSVAGIFPGDEWLVDEDSNLAVVPVPPLESAVSYYVEVPAGAFEDVSGNGSPAFGGPAGENAWAFAAVAPPAAAPLTADVPYTQSFSALVAPEPLPPGWHVVSSNPAAATTFPADPAQTDWGAGTSAGLRGNASVLGFQHSGVTEVVEKILTLENQTGATITDLAIGYVGRAVRLGEGRSPAYSVGLRTDWASPEAVAPIAALGYSTAGGDGASRTALIGGLEIAPGALFQVVWASERGAGSGFSKQIGIGNVSVSSGASPFPPSLAGPYLQAGTLTAVGVEVSAEVMSDGGQPVTRRGFVYALAADQDSPTIDAAGVTQLPDDSAAVGVFTRSIGGLQPGTRYSLRAYASNSEGTTYSATLLFNTLAAPPSFGGSFFEGFPGFAGVFPAGWNAWSEGGVENFVGNWTSGSSSGGFYGNASNPGVVGYTHTAGTGALTVKLTLVNDTGSALNELFVSYLGRVEALANTRLPKWTVNVAGIDAPEVGYSTGAGVDQQMAATFSGLNIPSGAQFSITWISDRGTGNGSSRRIGLSNVLVATEAPVQGAYAAWIDGFDVGSERGLTDDFDRDGIPNGLENYFGTNPAVANRGLTLVSGSKERLVLTHPVSAAPAADLSARYEWSKDLEVWTAAGGTFQGTTVTAGPVVANGTATVTATASGTAAARIFVRLKVTQP